MKRKTRNNEAGAIQMIMGGPSMRQNLIEVPSAPDIICYLYGPIEEESDYIDIIHAIRYAPEGQSITIHINSPGGSLNVCVAMINAMAATLADITTVIDGEACSAAAMIWLAGHTKVITSKHIILMVHTASTIIGGKLPEIRGNIEVSEKIMKRLLPELSKGLLTEAELVDINKGVDVWLTGAEIMLRLPINNEDSEEDEELIEE